MEIALNSAIASTTHPIKIIGGSKYPTLLDHNDNICNKNYNVTRNNKFFGVGHSILNLFGSSSENCSSKEEINALASLTLKNALNVKCDNANECDVQKLVEKAKNNEKELTQCNSKNDLAQQHQKQHQHTKSPSKSSELLAALKVTKSSTTSKQAKNKSLNLSTSSSVSSSSSTSSSSSSEAPSLTSSSVSGSSLSLLSSTLSTSPSTSAATSTTVQLITSPTTTTNSPNSTLTSSTFVTGSPGSGNGIGSGVGVASIKNGLQIPSDILDDLASRFIINVPDMELNNMIRICFQIELAHWFYLDFFCGGSAATTAAVATEQQKQQLGGEANKKRKLPTCGIKQFAIQVFQHIPFLREHLSSIDKILDDWKNYKLAVPTFGAILISEDLNFCLLVQSYFAKCSWGFPKGKVNENEDPVHCATREVYEETGYDITHLIVPNDYIEAVINYQYTRLYIVRDVSLKTQFSPRTRNEIKCCDWFPIDSLPINKNDAISKAKLGLNANSFFMIMPFIKRLKRWVHDKRSGIDTRRKFSEGDNANVMTNTPTTLMATAAVAAAAAAALAGNGNGNATQTCNQNNQKQFNVNNNSGKKNKQQQLQQTQNNKSDDKLNVGSVGNTTTNNVNNNIESSTAAAATKNNNKSDNSSKRSKRQRHKSMGDLDGIKLNNLSSNSCKSNIVNTCKNNDATSINIMTTASNGIESTTDSNESSVVSVGESGNCKTVSGQKRSNGSAVKLVAAGSSSNGHNNNSVAGATSKRHLFHSQSQNSCNQNGEKIVSSFDLIRKERQQQLKAAAAAAAAAAAQTEQDTKAQRQQLQPNATAAAGYNSGRVRAKSQGDKMYIQQHNVSRPSNTSNNNTGGNLKSAVVQRQISNSSTTTKTSNNDNNYINNTKNNTNKNTATNTARIASNPSPPSGGSELLALAAEIATSLSITTPTATVTTVTNTVQKHQQKQRPASVSLHFETNPILQAAGHQAMQQQQQLQRMASGTNLRILKRSTSLQIQQKQQPQQQQKQLLQQQLTETRSIPQLERSASFLQQTQQQLQNHHQQQTELKFKPSFNSWTNFSFTKNFIANVFC